MDKQIKVSVIVPCYNSAKFIEQSVSSLFAQYHENIEIICVNDGSTDETEKVLLSVGSGRDNFKVITLEQNQGLFNARLKGVEAATGEYIAFLDSDDYVTRNWISFLVSKAAETGADLVFGDMRKKGRIPGKKIDSKRCSYYNLDPLRNIDLDMDGRGVLDLFMKAHGLCSHYHYIWNKLIRRDLWERALADLTRLNFAREHLVMGEDIAFSATLFIFAQKVVNVHNAYYVYCIHDDQSVNTSNLEKFNKNVGDLVAIFDYLDDLLLRYGYAEKYASERILFRQRYGMIYFRLARELCLPKRIVSYVSEVFCQDQIRDLREVKSERFLDQMTNVAEIDDVYFSLLDKIYSSQIKVISFDVFDTLVTRPFAKPLDIFAFLNKPFTEAFGIKSYVDFANIRHNSEQRCHKLWKALKPGVEEPCLDDIYDEIAATYGYDREKLHLIEELEIENEIKYSFPRKSACALFELAKASGKKVILVSDMYLPRECIEKILSKCGISGYDKFYLSNEYHLTKHSGRLYRVVASDLKETASPAQILHIGDNYDSDVKRAKEAGFLAQHYPAAMGLLAGRNPGIFTGKAYHKIFDIADRYTDMNLSLYSYLGLRSCLAVAANKIFDFPFVSFNKDSDLNGDPRVVGYYVVGMHIFALARWLIKQTRGKGIRKIHFAARDGFLIKQAYDILTEGLDGVPQSSYIRVSRKAFAIADIGGFNDIHSIVQKLNYASQTPDSIFELFKPVMSEEAQKAYSEYRDKNQEVCVTRFVDRDQFAGFISEFYRSYLDDAAFALYQEEMREYFKKIFSSDDVFFDVGYSGRVELVLNKLLGFRIRSFYIHANNDYLNRRCALGDIEITCFYNYKPIVTGVVREHIISELAPSTIGYHMQDGHMEPVFEEYDMNYPTEFVTKAVQESALEFVSDMHLIFGADAVDLFAREFELSRPFEYYLHYSRSFDRNIFGDLEFEDDMGEGHKVSGMEFWNRSLARIRSEVAPPPPEPLFPPKVKKRNRFMRALYLFIFDRAEFVKKLRNKFHRK